MSIDDIIEKIKTLESEIAELELKRDEHTSPLVVAEFHNRNIVPKGLKLKNLKEQLNLF